MHYVLLIHEFNLVMYMQYSRYQSNWVLVTQIISRARPVNWRAVYISRMIMIKKKKGELDPS